MPTYRLTAPDGKVYQVTGEGTAEDALAQLQASLGQTQPNTPPPNSESSAVAQPTESIGDRMTRYGKETGIGLRYAGQKASAGIAGLLPNAAEQFLVSKGLSPSQAQLADSKAAVKAAGPVADAAAFVGDIGTQFLPSKKITQATQGLAGWRALVANMAGQGAINSALTPEDRGIAAAIGAGATGVGAGVARFLGGPLRKLVSKDGQTLLDAGIPITPGQAVTGPNAGFLARGIRTAEDRAGSIPVMGDVLRYKAHQANATFINQEINAALAPLKVKVSGVGREALDSAREQISRAYDQALPETSLPVATLTDITERALAKVQQTHPLFNTTNAETLRLFDGRRIQDLVAAGKDLDGLTARHLDTELGEFIRKFSSNPNNIANMNMAAGFKAVQDELRANLVGKTPEALSLLSNARMARAKLEPIFQAADAATGTFSAKGLVKTIEKRGDSTPLQKAAATVLPNVEPDSGTAGRTIFHALLTPQAAGAGAAAGAGSWLGAPVMPLLAGAGGALAAYSKPGMKYLTSGVHPVVEMLRKPNLTRDEVEQAMQFLTSQPLRAGLNTSLLGE